MRTLCKLLRGRFVWTAAFVRASLFLGLFVAAPSGKAQEVNPDHFTVTGVETFEGSTQRPATVPAKTKAQQANSRQETKSRGVAALPRAARHQHRRSVTPVAGQ
jgi:hypothetical protein